MASVILLTGGNRQSFAGLNMGRCKLMKIEAGIELIYYIIGFIKWVGDVRLSVNISGFWYQDVSKPPTLREVGG